MSGIGNAADCNSVALWGIVGSSPTLPTNNAVVAQQVAQRADNAEVVGSSPADGTINNRQMAELEDALV